MKSKVMPYNLEAEMSIIGCCLISCEVVWDVLADLTKDDFYFQWHRNIFSAIEYLAKNGRNVDIITVSNELNARKILEQCGGAQYLAQCMDIVPSIKNITTYIDAVKEHSKLRQIIRFTQRANESAWSLNNSSEIILQLQSDIINLISKKIKFSTTKIGEIIQREINTLDGTEDEELRIPYGFSDIDKATAGLGRGDLVVIGATPSMGKSALALQIAINAVRNNANTVYFSLEMTKEKIAQRALSLVSGISNYFVRTKRLDEHSIQVLIYEASKLYGYNLFIDDSSSMTLYDLYAKCKQLKIMYDINLIILDYLGLMALPHTDNRAHAYGDIAKACKNIAKELGVSFILISQLSREVSGNKPKLYHLKESGDIEASADVVMFLWAKDINETRRTLIIAKDRNHGGTGEWELAYNHFIVKFIDHLNSDEYTTIINLKNKQALLEYMKSKDNLYNKRNNLCTDVYEEI